MNKKKMRKMYKRKLPYSFKDLVFKSYLAPDSNYKRAAKHFDNGYGISVIIGDIFYSDGVSTYEVLLFTNSGIKLDTGDEDLQDELFGYLTAQGVNEIMKKVQMLKAIK